ncbi:hypothetical protein EV424DRAFT_744426 [Suillus variegatus]|nr:hypothetical protein EV424DRAFT_744426 [Suillus variegatus]
MVTLGLACPNCGTETQFKPLPFRLIYLGSSWFSYYTALSVAAFPMTGCFYSIRREICYGFLCYADLTAPICAESMFTQVGLCYKTFLSDVDSRVALLRHLLVNLVILIFLFGRTELLTSAQEFFKSRKLP